MMTAILELVNGEAGCWEACLLLEEWLARTDSNADKDRSKDT
jgi:hypothetical protein